ncbi:MAG: hypothetical protein WAR21_00300 [Candidatus Acidiferrales bacterium]
MREKMTMASGGKTRQSLSGQAERQDARLEPERGFHPEDSVLDYMTHTALSQAFKNGFAPPFRLRFTDANQGMLREVQVRVRASNVSQTLLFAGEGDFLFPLMCHLTDSAGRTHEIVVSPEEMTTWMEAAAACGSRYIQFPARLPEVSQEVYSAVRGMLVAAAMKSLEPPFTVEVRDAEGKLFGTREIYVDNDGDLRGGRDVADCAHLPFPVTVKLADRNGVELVEVVGRSQ